MANRIPTAAARRYLVELPVGVGYEDLAAVAARARSSAGGDAPGNARFLRAIAVPDDALCLLLFEAPSRASVAAAIRALGLRAASISTSLAAGVPAAVPQEEPA